MPWRTLWTNTLHEQRMLLMLFSSALFTLNAKISQPFRYPTLPPTMDAMSWLSRLSAPLESKNRLPSSSAIDLSSPSPPDRHFTPFEEEAVTSRQIQVIDLITSSPPRASSGMGLSPHRTTAGQPAGIDLAASPPSSLRAPRQYGVMGSGPRRITEHQAVRQRHDPQLISRFYTPPGTSCYNPLSLLGEYIFQKYFFLLCPSRRAVKGNSECANLHLKADAAELVSTTQPAPYPSSLTEEDIEAAQLLMQLHEEDALLAHSNTAIVSDTDSEATIPDTTPYVTTTPKSGRSRWPSPTSSTETASARRKKLRAKAPSGRRRNIPESGPGGSGTPRDILRDPPPSPSTDLFYRSITLSPSDRTHNQTTS
jgi:hypothetical protein